MAGIVTERNVVTLLLLINYFYLLKTEALKCCLFYEN